MVSAARRCVACESARRNSRAIKKSGNVTLDRDEDSAHDVRPDKPLASITMKIAAARKKNRMSTVIDRDAGVTFVSERKDLPAGRKSVMLLKFAAFWLHVAISAAIAIIA